MINPTARGKRILVTGVAGLLGRRLAELCAGHGCVVSGVARSPRGTKAEYDEIVVDLLDPEFARRLPTHVDAVIHLAQSSRFREFPESASDLFGVNVHATASLLDYALRAGASQFVYASSGGVYGANVGHLSEKTLVQEMESLGHYLGSKICGEILTRSYARYLNASIIRPFFIYGPRQRRDMLIPRLFDRVKSGMPIQLQGSNGIRINPIHVDDAAEALWSLVDQALGVTVNIAGPDVLSIRDVAEGFATYQGTACSYELVPGEAQDLVADISLMRSTLHKPTRRLLDSIGDVAKSG